MPDLSQWVQFGPVWMLVAFLLYLLVDAYKQMAKLQATISEATGAVTSLSDSLPISMANVLASISHLESSVTAHDAQARLMQQAIALIGERIK
jgi:hypothetical protein